MAGNFDCQQYDEYRNDTLFTYYGDLEEYPKICTEVELEGKIESYYKKSNYYKRKNK